MEILQADHEPRTYPDNRFSSNTWGPLPPRSYFRFDAAAVESERHSLETSGTPLAPLTEANQKKIESILRQCGLSVAAAA